jgi:hypothetical protein
VARMKPNAIPPRRAGAALEMPAGSLAALLVALLLTTAAAPAQERDAQEPSPQPAAPPQGVPETLWQFGEHEKFCLEWTDDCRVCRRIEARQIACSNVGIACLPKRPRCTLGEGSAK